MILNTNVKICPLDGKCYATITDYFGKVIHRTGPHPTMMDAKKAAWKWMSV